jgi:hypothetical protein
VEFTNLSPWAGHRAEGMRIMRAAKAVRAKAMRGDLRRRVREAARAQGITVRQYLAAS